MLGIGAGFAPADMIAGMSGYTWLSRFHLTGTLIAMVVGGSLGLILGMVLDSKLTSPRSRETVLGRLWAILFIGALLFLFFRPAFQATLRG